MYKMEQDVRILMSSEFKVPTVRSAGPHLPACRTCRLLWSCKFFFLEIPEDY